MLAQFGERMRPAFWTPPPPVYHELEQRLRLRQQLLAARPTAQNQLHALRAGAVVIASVQTRLEALIAFPDQQRAALAAALPTVRPTEGEWAANFGFLLSIKGIGMWTALWLLVATVNFTSCASAAEAVGYAGLGPRKHRSGTSVAGREPLPRGGHGRLRAALY